MKEYFKTNNGILYNGDCREIISVFDNNIIDLVVTSPPYNVGIDYDTYIDNMPFIEYMLFIKEVFTLIYDKLKVSGRCAINIPYEANMKPSGDGRVFMAYEYWKVLSEIGFKFAGIVDLTEVSPHRPKLTSWGSWLLPSAPYIYNPKECIILCYKDVWKKEHKGISYFKEGTADLKNEFKEYVFGCWKYNAETKKITKANFSLDIPLKSMKILSWKNDLILDPFMGSGTTAIAAEMLDRQWIGCELSEKYCSIAEQRIGNEHLFF